MNAPRLPLSETVLALAHLLASQAETLTLTHPYKGLVLSENVRVLSVEENQVVLQAHDTRILPVLKNCIHLHSQLFPYPVSASLVDLNQWTGKIRLQNLIFTGSEWKVRNGDRVQPRGPTYVTIRSGDNRITACLEDISKTGLGMVAYRLLERGADILTGDSVRLDFRLMEKDRVMSMNGIVVGMSRVGQSLVRIGVRFVAKPVQAWHLDDYINTRKNEILSELELTNRQSTERYRVEALYF